MTRTIKNVALVVSAVILFFFVLFVVNQTAQVVGLADRVSPAFGTAVLWFLLGLYAALVMASVVFFLRLQKPLAPPDSEMEPEFSRHLEALRNRAWPQTPVSRATISPAAPGSRRPSMFSAASATSSSATAQRPSSSAPPFPRAEGSTRSLS